MRIEDERNFDRTERATVMRIGTVKAVGTSTLDVDVPGGTLTGLAQLSTFTGSVGMRVLLLIDNVRAVVVGPLK